MRPSKTHAAVASCLALVALPGTASAGTVSSSGGTVTFAAGAGEANAISARYASDYTTVKLYGCSIPNPRIGTGSGSCGWYDHRLWGHKVIVVQDAGAPLAAGAGCKQVSSNSASCAVGSFNLSLNDGADRSSALPSEAVVDGGTGSDVLEGGGGDDRFLARDGSADSVSCGWGSDSVVADPKDRVAADCESVQR